MLLGVPRWAASILVPTVALLAALAYTRGEWRAVRGAAAPSRAALGLAAAHVLLPLVGVPLAVEGLRTDNRPLAVVGTSLLVLVVVNSAVILPWRTARRQKRERAGRAR